MSRQTQDFVTSFEQRIGRKLKDRERGVLSELYENFTAPKKVPEILPAKVKRVYSVIVNRTRVDCVQFEVSATSSVEAKAKALEGAPDQDFSRTAKAATYEVSKFWVHNKPYKL